MGKYAKWVGGALGWAVGGPIGALFGYAVGTIFDKGSAFQADAAQGGTRQQQQQYRHKTTTGDFMKAFTILTAAVMKADGKVMRSELNYAKAFYERQFGKEGTKDFLEVLKKLLDQNIDVREICRQIRFYMEHPLRLQLLHYLFGLAKADGRVDADEVNVIEQISINLGISTKDFESLKAMFYKSTDSAYTILEIEKSATNSEVKKAYRKMAMKYHPDKVLHMGEEFKKSAQEKFLSVQEAYDNICQERGLK